MVIQCKSISELNFTEQMDAVSQFKFKEADCITSAGFF